MFVACVVWGRPGGSLEGRRRFWKEPRSEATSLVWRRSVLQTQLCRNRFECVIFSDVSVLASRSYSSGKRRESAVPMPVSDSQAGGEALRKRLWRLFTRRGKILNAQRSSPYPASPILGIELGCSFFSLFRKTSLTNTCARSVENGEQ